MSDDTDCNQVAYFPDLPNHTSRCTQPEGHVGMCWMGRQQQVMRHKHRKPIATFTDPFELVPVGGRHRRPVVAAVGCGEVRRRLAVAVERSAVS